MFVQSPQNHAKMHNKSLALLCIALIVVNLITYFKYEIAEFKFRKMLMLDGLNWIDFGASSFSKEVSLIRGGRLDDLDTDYWPITQSL